MITLVLIAACFLYLLYLRAGGVGIPCAFHKITGWKCPGCGISTLLLKLSYGDFRGARAANPFLYYTLPLLAAQIIYYFFLKKQHKPLPRWNNRLLFVYLAALLLFGVVRNIYSL